MVLECLELAHIKRCAHILFYMLICLMKTEDEFNRPRLCFALDAMCLFMRANHGNGFNTRYYVENWWTRANELAHFFSGFHFKIGLQYGLLPAKGIPATKRH